MEKSYEASFDQGMLYSVAIYRNIINILFLQIFVLYLHFNIFDKTKQSIIMKKTLMLALLLCGTTIGFAQEIHWNNQSGCDYNVTSSGGNFLAYASGGADELSTTPSTTYTTISVTNASTSETLTFNFPTVPYNDMQLSAGTFPAPCSASGNWRVLVHTGDGLSVDLVIEDF